MRSFSLLRSLLYRTSSSPLYDHLPTPTISTLQSLLLHSLQNEPAQVVRRTSVDTVCVFANCSMNRGRPWHALQALAFAMTSAGIDRNSSTDLPVLPSPSPSSSGGLSLQIPSTPSQHLPSRKCLSHLCRLSHAHLGPTDKRRPRSPSQGFEGSVCAGDPYPVIYFEDRLMLELRSVIQH